MIIIFGIVYSYFENQVIHIEIGIVSDSYWGTYNLDTYAVIDEAIEIIESRYPNLAVSYLPGITTDQYSEFLSNQLIQGDAPDLFLVLEKDFLTFASTGALVQLDEYLTHDGINEYSLFYDSSIEAVTYHDRLYALPFEVNPQLMFVNTTLLELYNVDVPSSDWTWDEFYEICKKITQDVDHDGILDHFGSINYTWLEAIASQNINLFDSEENIVNLDSEQMVEVLQFLRNLQSLQTSTHATIEDFNNGAVAFQPFSYAEYRTYSPYPYSIKRYIDFEWEIIALPHYVENYSSAHADTVMFAINAATPHEDYAWELLKLLTLDETIQSSILTKSQGLPALDMNYDEINDMQLSLAQEVMKKSQSARFFHEHPDVKDYIENEIYRISDGSGSLYSEAFQLQQKVDGYMNR